MVKCTFDRRYTQRYEECSANIIIIFSFYLFSFSLDIFSIDHSMNVRDPQSFMSSCYRWISVKRVRTQSSLHINIGTHSPHLALIYNSHVITLLSYNVYSDMPNFYFERKTRIFFKREYFVFTFGNIKYFISGWYGCYWCYFKWVIRLMDFWNVDKNLKSVSIGNKMFLVLCVHVKGR